MSGGTIKAGDGCGYPCGYDCNLACFDRATPANATDTAGLVERLHKYGKDAANPAVIADYSEELALQAATALSALRAENERLTAERDKANQRAESQWAGWIKEGVARKTAEAERDRLQAELARVNQTLTTACILAADELRTGDTA